MIVAVPSAGDSAWKVSSEEVPHLTLIYMARPSTPELEQEVIEFVHHAASMIHPFMLDTSERGPLGDSDADVAFLDVRRDSPIQTFRGSLIQNSIISSCMAEVEQFSSWTPHITLGYPDAPAKEPEDEYSLRWFQFDKIAIWTDDFSGPEIPLKYQDQMEVAMSDRQTFLRGEAVLADTLEHYGVKGMKWGVSRSSDGTVTVTEGPNKRLTTTGGKGKPASEDAKAAATGKQIIRKSGIQALSNVELKRVVERMNLEAQFSNLVDKKVYTSAGQKAFGSFLSSALGTQAKQMATNELSKRVKDAMGG